MLCHPSIRRLAAATAFAMPAALSAQATSGSAAVERQAIAALTITADPWLVIYSGRASTTQARAARANVRANVDRIDAAIEPYGTRYNALTDDARFGVRKAFEGVVPRQRFSAYRLNDAQARAIVFLALGPLERLQAVPACARDDRGDRDRGRDWNRDRDNRPGPPGRPGRSSGCQAQIDTLSRDAAWIHATGQAMGRTGTRRPREDEAADLQSMTERARTMVISSNRCGCPAALADAESLLTATRDAQDAFNASSMAAWMSIGATRFDRIGKLSDALERTFIRCLSE